MASLIDGLASRGVRRTVCRQDLSPNVRRIGLAIKRSLGVASIETAPLRDVADDPGIQPACVVTEETAAGSTELPPCPADGTCYELRADPDACPEIADHARVVIVRDGAPAAGARIDVRCEPSA